MSTGLTLPGGCPLNKPIVASRIGGFPETIHDGVHGYLVEPGSVTELSAALTRVLGDEGLRRRMSDSVRQLAETTLSWREIGRATASLYERILTTHDRREYGV